MKTKVINTKKKRPIIYMLALSSAVLTLSGCNPNLYVNNSINTNVITKGINIDDYITSFDPIESDYIISKTSEERPYQTNYSRLSLESSGYISSNPSEYGFIPVDLDELNKYSVYYILDENKWIEPYLNDKQYTCKNISIEKYIDEEGEEYILYRCDVYVVNEFDNGKTIALSGKYWPIQDIAYEVPIAPVETFYVTYQALSKVEENGYIKLIADKQEGYDQSSVYGNLDDILIKRKAINFNKK